MANILKSTLVYTLGNIIPKAASFILLPVYTLYLTPADYGIIEAVLAISPILLILFSFSFGASIFRLYHDYKNEEDQRTFFSTIFIATIIISSFFLICLFLFQNQIEQIYSAIPFSPFFLYVILTAFVSNLFDMPQKYLMLTGKSILFVSLSLFRFTLNTSLILWFIIYEKEGASGYLKSSLISALIISPVYLVLTVRMINFKFSFTILKNILSFSLPLIPTLLSAWVLDLSDRIFLERWFSLSEVGIYSLSYKIAGVVLLVVTSFGMAYRPLFFKFANSKNVKEGRKMIYKYNYIFLLLFILLAFSVSFLSKEIIILLFSYKYIEAYFYVPLIVLAYLFSVAGGLVARFFEQSKRMRANMYIYLGIAIVNIGLNYFFIPQFGAYGAALATIISLLLGFVIGYIYARKYCYFVPFNWSKLWPVFVLLILVFIIFNSFLAFDNVYYSLVLKSLIIMVLIVLILGKYIKDYRFLLSKK